MQYTKLNVFGEPVRPLRTQKPVKSGYRLDFKRSFPNKSRYKWLQASWVGHLHIRHQIGVAQFGKGGRIF